MENIIQDDESSLPIFSAFQKAKLNYMNQLFQDKSYNIPNKEAYKDVILIPEKKILVFATFKRIIEYNMEFKKSKVIEAHESNVQCLLKIPFQNILISGGLDGNIIVWDFFQWKQIREYSPGGGIYYLVPLKKKSQIAYLCARKEPRKDCEIAVWDFEENYLVSIIPLEMPWYTMTPKMGIFLKEYDILVSDETNGLHYVNLMSQTSKKLPIELGFEKNNMISCIHIFELKDAKFKAPPEDLWSIVTGKDRPLIEDRIRYPKAYFVYVLVGGYTGKLMLYRGDRSLEKFSFKKEVQTNKEECMIYDIEVIKPRKKHRLILVRTAKEVQMYDFDLTLLSAFALPSTQRFFKTITQIGREEQLVYVISAKGEVISYRMENVIQLFLHKLGKAEKVGYHPYVYMDVFKMLFVHDNYTKDNVLM